MVLVVHILIALSSLVYVTLLWLNPTQQKFYVSYGLVAATVGSGTYLVVTTHSPLLASCETGLIYLGVAFAGIVAAHYRYVRVRVRNK